MIQRLATQLKKADLTDPIDTLTLDVPLFIRLLEYAREDAKTDMDLHNLLERALQHKNEGPLGMDHYDLIIPPAATVQTLPNGTPSTQQESAVAGFKQAINGYSVVPKDKGWIAVNGKTIAQVVKKDTHCMMVLSQRDGGKQIVQVPGGSDMTLPELAVWLEAWLKANPAIISQLEM